MISDDVIKTGEQTRVELVTAVLEYIEGRSTLQSILALGVKLHDSKNFGINLKLSEVVSQIYKISEEINKGTNYSDKALREIFTNILQKLTGK